MKTRTNILLALGSASLLAMSACAHKDPMADYNKQLTINSNPSNAVLLGNVTNIDTGAASYTTLGTTPFTSNQWKFVPGEQLQVQFGVRKVTFSPQEGIGNVFIDFDKVPAEIVGATLVHDSASKSEGEPDD